MVKKRCSLLTRNSILSFLMKQTRLQQMSGAGAGAGCELSCYLRFPCLLLGCDTVCILLLLEPFESLPLALLESSSERVD